MTAPTPVGGPGLRRELRRGNRVQRVGAWLGGRDGRETLGRRLGEVHALECWPDLVGPHIAKKTRPMRLAGGRLFVVANGSALRQELTFHKDTILAKFNEAAGRRAAREIVFLESDAQLSSLVEHGGEAAVAPRVSQEHAQDGPASGESGSVEPDASPYPTGPAYEPFDAERYRRELSRRE